MANIKRRILDLDEEHIIHDQIQEGKSRLKSSGRRGDRMCGDTDTARGLAGVMSWALLGILQSRLGQVCIRKMRLVLAQCGFENDRALTGLTKEEAYACGGV